MVGPPALTRYNGFPAVEITGTSATGRSSGEAMQAVEGIVERQLPHAFGNDWAGQSLQELISVVAVPLKKKTERLLQQHVDVAAQCSVSRVPRIARVGNLHMLVQLT